MGALKDGTQWSPVRGYLDREALLLSRSKNHRQAYQKPALHSSNKLYFFVFPTQFEHSSEWTIAMNKPSYFSAQHDEVVLPQLAG